VGRRRALSTTLAIHFTDKHNKKAKSEDSIIISDQSALLMGRYARLAQAVHLLSQTLHHVRRDPTNDEACVQEANHLRRTLLALLNLSEFESRAKILKFCNQSAVCYRCFAFSGSRKQANYIRLNSTITKS
jgi:hypothetical protein